MQPNDLDNEGLQEKLLDLLRRNDQVQQQQTDAAALLDIMQVTGSAQSRTELLTTLLQGLQVLTGHQHVAVLERSSELSLIWTSSFASTNVLVNSVWQSGQVFERALNGDVVALFKPEQVDEFRQQERDICELAGSALVFGLESVAGVSLVVLFHAEKNSFTPNQKEAVRRLKPMAEQRLQNLEYDLKLRDLVARRTNELRHSQKRLACFARTSSDWFWEVDEEFRFSYTSKLDDNELPELRGNLYGKTIMELRTATESQNLNKWFAVTRTFQERQPIRGFEFELALPKRNPVWIRINGEPFYSEQGVFLGYRGTAKNISLRKSQDRQLSQQIQQVSNRSKLIEHDTENVLADVSQASHVLLVDDCESSQMITQLMLVNLGYTTSVVESGVKALNFDDLESVDAVLMDLEMPDMSGEEVSRAMRDKGLTMPILALTGCSFGERGEQVAASGMNGFIEKPVRLNVLQQELGQLLTN
ncbi:response regulator [Neiella marina]|uniref:Response regulator n=1 Tax=Neiella holothuriorum TaxID=2870530 RepID=A0ABS7EIX1_9GAMM|nr:response regulator [Neiella holothuriorum]MBW8192289.1 response regulator [Neiella holothuriorum]